jgi:hypothetical protein
MADVPPAIVKLEVLVPDDYNEEAVTAVALAASTADEDSKWSWQGLEDVVHLSAMVAEHIASLPLPPPLPPHAPPHAAWDGSDGSTSFGVRAVAAAVHAAGRSRRRSLLGRINCWRARPASTSSPTIKKTAGKLGYRFYF